MRATSAITIASLTARIRYQSLKETEQLGTNLLKPAIEKYSSNTFECAASQIDKAFDDDIDTG
jgi:hypothetical protein